MSLRKRLLNWWLKTTERPHMARATPEKLRSAFEMKARLLFHAPRKTAFERVSLGDVPALSVTGPEAAGPGAIYYIHGGGFVFGSPNTHKAMLARLSQLTGLRAVLPDYRKAPEAPFPAAPRDVRAGWDALIASGIPASEIVVGGDSAGGTLALGLVAELLREGAALPAGAFGLSALTDLTFSGESFSANSASEVVLPAERAEEMTEMYVGSHAAGSAELSPCFADFTGAPPVYLAAGTTEILLDDSVRMAQAIRDAGGDVTLDVQDDLPHVWPMFFRFLPEADLTLKQVAQWIRALPTPTGGS